VCVQPLVCLLFILIAVASAASVPVMWGCPLRCVRAFNFVHYIRCVSFRLSSSCGKATELSPLAAAFIPTERGRQAITTLALARLFPSLLVSQSPSSILCWCLAWWAEYAGFMCHLTAVPAQLQLFCIEIVLIMGPIARRRFLSCRHSAYVIFVYICIAMFYVESERASGCIF